MQQMADSDHVVTLSSEEIMQMCPLHLASVQKIPFVSCEPRHFHSQETQPITDRQDVAHATTDTVSTYVYQMTAYNKL